MRAPSLHPRGAFYSFGLTCAAVLRSTSAWSKVHKSPIIIGWGEITRAFGLSTVHWPRLWRGKEAAQRAQQIPRGSSDRKKKPSELRPGTNQQEKNLTLR